MDPEAAAVVAATGTGREAENAVKKIRQNEPLNSNG